MPLYLWKCRKCGFEREELRKAGDYESPKCVYCDNEIMERLFTPVASILKGSGWTRGNYTKLRNRSKEQGKKFFKRHDNLKEMSEKSVNEKPTA